MSFNERIGAPFTLATLSKPVGSTNGRIHAASVCSLSGLKKRKRTEIAVGLDGEGISIYSVCVCATMRKHLTKIPTAPKSPTCNFLRSAAKHCLHACSLLSLSQRLVQGIFAALHICLGHRLGTVRQIAADLLPREVFWRPHRNRKDGVCSILRCSNTRARCASCYARWVCDDCYPRPSRDFRQRRRHLLVCGSRDRSVGCHAKGSQGWRDRCTYIHMHSEGCHPRPASEQRRHRFSLDPYRWRCLGSSRAHTDTMRRCTQAQRISHSQPCPGPVTVARPYHCSLVTSQTSCILGLEKTD